MKDFRPLDVEKRIKDGETFQGWSWSANRGQNENLEIGGSPDGENIQIFTTASIINLLNHISSGVNKGVKFIPDTFWKDVEFKCDSHGEIQHRPDLEEDWEETTPGELIYAILDMQLTIYRLQKVIDDNNLR